MVASLRHRTSGAWADAHVQHRGPVWKPARPLPPARSAAKMTSEHIVKSFDDELKRLSHMVAQMGGLAEAQLQTAIEALVARDAEEAARVVQNDVRIDQIERQI